MGTLLGLPWGAGARLSTSLVANPLRVDDPIIGDRQESGGNARPDPVAIIRTSMDTYSDLLATKFFGRDKIDKKKYTIWIFASLGLILGIWVVAALGFMTSVAAISSVLFSSSIVKVAAAPLYAGLLAVLTIPFVAILFMVHRARRPAWREPVSGFAGFAWDLQD